MTPKPRLLDRLRCLIGRHYFWTWNDDTVCVVCGARSERLIP